MDNTSFGLYMRDAGGVVPYDFHGQTKFAPTESVGDTSIAISNHITRRVSIKCELASHTRGPGV